MKHLLLILTSIALFTAGCAIKKESTQLMNDVQNSYSNVVNEVIKVNNEIEKGKEKINNTVIKINDFQDAIKKITE